MQKNSVIVSVAIIVVALLMIAFSFNSYSSINISANPVLELAVNEAYEIPKAQATIGNKDVSAKVTSSNDININEIGDYTITYSIKSLIFSKLVVTEVKVVDNLAPTINFNGNRIIVTDGSDVNLSYLINDNYYSPDEILIETSDNVDYSKDGTYFINYKLIDPSKNTSTFQREIIVDHNFEGLTLKSWVILNQTKNPLIDYELIADEIINEQQPFDSIRTIYDLNKIENWLYENQPNYLVLNVSYYDIQEKSILDVIDEYQKAIRELMTLAPKTRIYICSTLPSYKDETLSNHDILIYNYYLLKLCEDLNVRYVNINEAFVDAENKTIDSYFETANTLNVEGIKVFNTYLAKHLQPYNLLKEY